MKELINIEYNNIISIENLLEAWKEFLSGKKNRKDVQQFERNLMSNIISLHEDLSLKTYKHSEYEAFNVYDPKPRNIHKATVGDRLLHHAIYRILYPYFDRLFIHDSYFCRIGKGTHKAMNRFRDFGRMVGKNNTKKCWVLKCDVRKFFASVDHHVLLQVLNKWIDDKDVLWLLERVIKSFDPGLPLGNLTSQLLVNIYMNEFDQWMKHRMKIKYYIRYADDFVIIDADKDKLFELTPKITDFLAENLKLQLHPDKVFIKTLASGVDFLGWVHFPNHRVLRTVTKRRMMKKLSEKNLESYLGMLRHGNAYKLQEVILSKYAKVS